MEKYLEQLVQDCAPYAKQGKLADYIPELSKADPNAIGIHIITNDGKHSSAGSDTARFTIQSIIKPILLLLALMDNGIETVRSKVGVEATGKPFDALNATEQKLDSEHINPMVNMGAIAMCSLIHGESYAQKFERLLELTRKLASDPTIGVDEAVYLSEKSHGSRNRSLAYLLKSYGMLDDNVEDVLDCYFRACSISVTCENLANIGSVLANRGKVNATGEQVFPAHFASYVNAILTTCGMYDGSGEFAIRVGLPAKSGVGGGIMAVAPGKMGIGIYAPALDAKGNSVAGICMLEKLSEQLQLSIF